MFEMPSVRLSRPPTHTRVGHPSPGRRASVAPARRSTHATSTVGTVGLMAACIVGLVAAASTIMSASNAHAVDFQVDFRSSTYQVMAGDTFSDLLAQHQSESLIQSNTTTGLEDISTSVYAAGVNRDYSVFMGVTLDVAVAGQYTFQVGTDWGRGGATALIDNNTGSILSERVIADDLWWGQNWNDPDVFTTTFDFAAGDDISLVWVGFEGCCGGTSTIRFSVDGSAFTPLTDPAIAPFVSIVPEPTTALMMALGLGGLATVGPRRKS